MANRVTITICGEEYTLVADESSAYMQKVGSLSAIRDRGAGGRQGRPHRRGGAHRRKSGGRAVQVPDRRRAAPVQIKGYLDEASKAQNEVSESSGGFPPPAALGRPEVMALELLSPAGSPEALRAAVQSGCGAVYLGWGDVQRRRGAKNFHGRRICRCHRYCISGRPVFLTLNTLLTDRELPLALDAARTACRLGVDSVLVQDWGLFALLREPCRTSPFTPALR